MQGLEDIPGSASAPGRQSRHLVILTGPRQFGREGLSEAAVNMLISKGVDVTKIGDGVDPCAMDSILSDHPKDTDTTWLIFAEGRTDSDGTHHISMTSPNLDTETGQFFAQLWNRIPSDRIADTVLVTNDHTQQEAAIKDIDGMKEGSCFTVIPAEKAPELIMALREETAIADLSARGLLHTYIIHVLGRTMFSYVSEGSVIDVRGRRKAPAYISSSSVRTAN